ncbi:hypothetical protein EYF80_008433 [Liparis tanakae]|uniref:Uncharacterized protein n=1 Tax=Liparis tanakae TaxID=230148 RepID=A0A4Z2IUF8_9TELE|nr:hypothetical protein EYF80_008433 [Liparis tanakae]
MWLDSRHHNAEWYLGSKVKDIDQGLLAINPPVEVTRHLFLASVEGSLPVGYTDKHVCDVPDRGRECGFEEENADLRCDAAESGETAELDAWDGKQIKGK